MMTTQPMMLAVKCAPVEPILEAAAKAGVEAVELFTDERWLRDAPRVADLCRGYPFAYAVHAPGEGHEPDGLAALVEGVRAKVVVLHDIYFEDEWVELTRKLGPVGCTLCLENVLSAIDTIKYMRRFGLARCLDIEHLILETSGIFEEPMFALMRQSAHVHMTGYVYGSRDWHTHLHGAPEQSRYLLGLLHRAGYRGFVVSEARTAFQNIRAFRELKGFFDRSMAEIAESGGAER